MDNECCKCKCDELAAQNEAMREAILQFRNEPMLEFAHAIRATNGYAAMECTALALPNTAADILRQRDARVLRDAMAHLKTRGCYGYSIKYLADKADELERQNG